MPLISFLGMKIPGMVREEQVPELKKALKKCFDITDAELKQYFVGSKLGYHFDSLESVDLVLKCKIDGKPLEELMDPDKKDGVFATGGIRAVRQAIKQHFVNSFEGYAEPGKFDWLIQKNKMDLPFTPTEFAGIAVLFIREQLNNHGVVLDSIVSHREQKALVKSDKSISTDFLIGQFIEHGLVLPESVNPNPKVLKHTTSDDSTASSKSTASTDSSTSKKSTGTKKSN